MDWLNQMLVVRGTGLTGVTAFTLGGSAPLPPASASDTVVEIAFDSTLAAEVDLAGNYQLKLDGADALSVFFRSSVVDSGATGCPCDTEWAADLGDLWGPPLETVCLEVPGPGTNDYADISGTVLSDPILPETYPHYPIGAAFVPGDPDASVCRLVEVGSDASVTDITWHRINEAQQADCAALLKAQICAP